MRERRTGNIDFNVNGMAVKLREWKLPQTRELREDKRGFGKHLHLINRADKNYDTEVDARSDTGRDVDRNRMKIDTEGTSD